MFKNFSNSMGSNVYNQLREISKHPYVGGLTIFPAIREGAYVPTGVALSLAARVPPKWVEGVGEGVLSVNLGIHERHLPERMKIILYRELLSKVPKTPVPVRFRTQDNLLDSTPCTPYTASCFKDLGHSRMGTLGVDGDFIEVGKDSTGNIWLTIKTGASEASDSIINHYQEVADKLGNVYLSHPSPEFSNFEKDLNYLQVVGSIHRNLLLNRCIEIIEAHLPKKIKMLSFMNQAFTSLERLQDGELILRRGCSAGKANDTIVVLGNQADGSHIVRVTNTEGSQKSIGTCAGRRVKLEHINTNITLDNFRASIEGKWGEVTHMLSRYAPQAYKSTSANLVSQTKLFKIVGSIFPIMTVKA